MRVSKPCASSRSRLSSAMSLLLHLFLCAVRRCNRLAILWSQYGHKVLRDIMYLQRCDQELYISAYQALGAVDDVSASLTLPNTKRDLPDRALMPRTGLPTEVHQVINGKAAKSWCQGSLP